MLPAHQCLGSGDDARLHVDLGLIEDDQLILMHRIAQLVFQHQAFKG